MSTSALGTTHVCQVALVVHDIEKTAKAWADVLGLPVPAVHITDTVDKAQTRFRGQPTQARAKLAFLDLGQVQLELIEPIGGPSVWQEHLDRHGESVQHIAFKVPSMKAALANLAAKGIPLSQSGEFTGGRYAYVDGSDPLKLTLELLEIDPKP